LDDDRGRGGDYAARVARLFPRGDAALACGLALLGAVSLLVLGGGEAGGDRAPDALGYVLVVTAALVLSARRRQPVVVCVVSLSAAFAAGVLGYAIGGLPAIAPLLALGSAAYHTSRPTAIALVACASVGFAAIYVAFPPADGGAAALAVQIIPNVFLLFLAGLAGDVLREQHVYARKLEQRTLELARLRAAETRDAILEERTRIARDMHDIVGHALAAIALQARAGRRRLANGATDGADVAFAEIDTVAGHALADTRRAVGLLRAGDASAPPAPRPALGALDELVAALRTADVQIELRREGTPRAMPEPVEAAAYRIVQESLSNVIKHAHPARVTVRLSHDDESLVVDVRDDGVRRNRAHRPGHGLRGMRERVEALGGTLHAGPAADGGWQVHARLPQASA